MRQRLIVILGLVLLAITAATDGFADQNPNVALVIGNADYPDADAPLREPVNDAKALGDELRRRGFDVFVGQNLRKSAMQKALDDFFGKIGSNTTAVLFFSGFGIQSDRQSYLIPTDAQIWNEADVRRDGFVLDNILGEMTRRGAKAKIVIIDASRKNPFERRFRSLSAGLAPLSASRGSVVMTSAPADAIAETSPPVFVSNLLGKLKGSDAGIEQIFNDTRKDVSRLTNGAQVPGVTSSLDIDISLGRLASAGPNPAPNPGAGAPAVVSVPPAPPPAVTPPPPPPPAVVVAPPPPPPPPPVAVAPPPSPPPVAVAPPPPPPPPPVAVAPPPPPPPPPVAVALPPPPPVAVAPPPPPPPQPAPVIAAVPPPSAPAAPPPAVTPPADPEAAARHDYVLAEDTGTADSWKNFIAKYPSGYYHDMALQQLARVSPPAAPPPPPPAQPAPPPAAVAPPAAPVAPSVPNNTASADDADGPTDLPGFYRRGQRRAVAGDFTLAIADFSEVIHRDPKHAGALNDRCWVRALVGELQDALKDCNAALTIAPSYPDALDSRGLVNLKLGQYAKAVQDYNAALALDAKHASALYGRGIAKRHMGDNAGAKADIEAAKAVQSTIVDEFAGYGVQ